jgi:hypothetical protein
MTKQEFDEAVERLRQGHKAESDAEARVYVAAGFIIRQRRGIPDDQPWEGPTDAELAEFLAGIDRVRRKRLKEIAERLKRDVVGPAVPKTKH